MQDEIQRGFTIRQRDARETLGAGGGLYDIHSSFWQNFEDGPRPLSPAEEEGLESLRREADHLRTSTGARTDITIFGKKVPSPVAIAAGPAPNSKWLGFFFDLGYDLVTHKTVRDRHWTGHPMPNVVNVQGNFRDGFTATEAYTGTITNSLGMPSPSPDDWKRDVSKTVAMRGGRYVVVSVTATLGKGSTEDEMLEQFASLSGQVKSAGADAVEVNLSCPNVSSGEGGEVFTDARLSGRVADAVKAEVGSSYPLLVKVGYLPDYVALVDEVGDDRVGYVAINSVAAPVRDSEGNRLFDDRGGKAGIAGAALLDLTRSAVKGLADIKQKRDLDYEVFGVGGVADPSSALQILDDGAAVVESATAALWDPLLAMKVKKSLLERGASR